MTNLNISQQRLISQHIVGDLFERPDDVVNWLGAIQAQDYLGALWAIGLRMKNALEADIEQAIRDKTIVRAWLLHGTLHFAPAEDLRWMLEILAPRIILSRRSYMERLNLNDEIFAHSKEVLTSALQGGEKLTRKSMYYAFRVGEYFYYLIAGSSNFMATCNGRTPMFWSERRQTTNICIN